MTRTRFAPSPTGFLHVGGIRTALFAWLLARQNDGQFILRIEDTDRKREVSGAEAHIMDSLKWLGLDWDEGPDSDGSHGSYRQSERLDIYKKWAQKLIDSGRAYADPYTTAEVQAFRDEAIKNKQPFLYRNHRPKKPPAWDGTMPLRFKSNPKFLSNWEGENAPVVDEVMGDKMFNNLTIDPDTTDDVVLVKSDGFPTYNFAHIVDDAEMEITHVLRGQEFLSSMAIYMDIYHALGLKAPKFAHLPHIMNEQGNKKLSKRDGAKDILDYAREGYLPEALVSFIATLGWNDGTEQEVFTVNELIEKFSLDRVHKSGARFDERRLLWANGHFLRQLDIKTLYALSVGENSKTKYQSTDYWPEEAEDADEEYKKQVIGLVQERLKFLAELPQLTEFFFKDLPVNPELISSHKQLKKLEKDDLKTLLQTAREEIAQSDFTTDDLQNRLNALLTLTHTKPAVLFSLIRIATTQSPASPGLAETMTVLGRETTLRRIDQQLRLL
ncbi:MAG: glutamate--tRNA ligase [Candidatus Saccharibacteria bacterium]|nr:glutamate--tRNA ligase [Candidatus Saccharibacteria bacterium]